MAMKSALELAMEKVGKIESDEGPLSEAYPIVKAKI